MRAEFLRLCRVQAIVVLLYIAQDLFDIAFLKQHHDVVVMMPEVVPNGLCGQFILFCKLQLPLQILYIFADQFHFVFITQRPNRPENHPQHRSVEQHNRCEKKNRFVFMPVARIKKYDKRYKNH